MFTQRLRAYAARRWQEALPSFGSLRPALEARVEQTAGDEKTLLQLAYGTLPLSDVGSVPFEVIDSFGKHAIFLRETSQFCRGLPEELFLHFVWYPRVNSEDLTDCRAFFYHEISPRLTGLDTEEAVLEINRWCAEHMTYQLSDERTESPMTAYRTGTGRCGEETVFLVTALRSVGIPARQVYVPWWAHCDDNHAWTEVWVNGQWRFLGACEPEPILDRGWFTSAAARAPLVHYRVFFDYTGDDWPDRLVERQGSALLYNVTRRYAETFSLGVTVTYGGGQPAANVPVEIDVVNMAAFRPILRGRTDEHGRFAVQLGRAGFHVEAFADGLYAAADIKPEGETCDVSLILAPRPAGQRTYDADFAPPAPSDRNRTVLTAAQEAQNAAVLSACADLRRARAESRWKPEYSAAEAPWPDFFSDAGGNAPELYRFYTARAGKARGLAAQMLRAVGAKGRRDVAFTTLESHLQEALPFSDQEHFETEILNPRIGLEVPDNWRPAVREKLSEAQCAAFTAAPERFMAYIYDTYTDGGANYYPALSMTPSAVLATGHADEKGRHTLFVAGMRTLGVPARLNPGDGSPEYWRDGAYHRVNRHAPQTCEGTIRFVPQPGERFVYGVNWSLSRREEAGYRVLEHDGSDDPFRVSALPGSWRLITARRLPNGRQLCRVTDFTLDEGETADIALELRHAHPEEMLSRIPLERFTLRRGDGEVVSSEELFSRPGILIWVQPGTEPSEHILSELVRSAAGLAERMEAGLRLMLVLPDGARGAGAALENVLAAIPGIQLLYDSFGAPAERLARALFLEPGVWPLLVLADSKHRGRFAGAGYRVGVIETALELAKHIR